MISASDRASNFTLLHRLHQLQQEIATRILGDAPANIAGAPRHLDTSAAAAAAAPAVWKSTCAGVRLQSAPAPGSAEGSGQK